MACIHNIIASFSNNIIAPSQHKGGARVMARSTCNAPCMDCPSPTSHHHNGGATRARVMARSTKANVMAHNTCSNAPFMDCPSPTLQHNGGAARARAMARNTKARATCNAPWMDCPLMALMIMMMCSVLIASSASRVVLKEVQPPLISRPPCFLRKVFALGDSTTDTGNAIRTNNPVYHIAAHLPYGRDFATHEPTGRFSDGRLMIDFLMQALTLPYLPPHLATTSTSGMSQNFAVAGATALEPSLLKALANASSLTPYSLHEQIQWFTENIRSIEATSVSDNTLVYFGEIGGNDYNYAFAAASTATNTNVFMFEELVEKVISEIELGLIAILESGVRHVVVQGNFPMGCMPVYLQQAAQHPEAFAQRQNSSLYDEHGCVAAVSSVSDQHNLRLRQLLQHLTLFFPHADLVFFDTTAAYLYILDHASQFGFTNLTHPCLDLGTILTSPTTPPRSSPLPSLVACPNPYNYVSWDGIHPTQAMYETMLTLFLNLSLPNSQHTHPPLPFSFPPYNFLTTCTTFHT